MARTDNDTWDLATSVGSTATAVAVGRALASRATHPLISDPFAEPLVRAVGVDFFTRLASGELDPADADGGAELGMLWMRDLMAVRTRFFDEFFLGAAEAGIRQMVILASGLDARSYRLPWPAGTAVFDIDQPRVVDFVTATLAGLDASPTADRRPVAVDLRQDWPAALRQAGFDPDAPAAWSAEGLLPFLPPDAQDRLLDDITALSAPGSRLASENLADTGEAVPMMRDRLHEAVERWRSHGFDVDMTDLWYEGDRHDVGDYLNGHGWEATSTNLAGMAAAAGLSTRTDDRDETFMFRSMTYATGTRI